MNCPSDRADCFLFDGSPLKKALTLSFEIFPVWGAVCPAYDPGTKGDNSADDDCCTLYDNIMIAVKECDNRIRSFLNTDNMIRIQVHGLSVHTCQNNHADPE